MKVKCSNAGCQQTGTVINGKGWFLGGFSRPLSWQVCRRDLMKEQRQDREEGPGTGYVGLCFFLPLNGIMAASTARVVLLARSQGDVFRAFRLEWSSHRKELECCCYCLWPGIAFLFYQLFICRVKQFCQKLCKHVRMHSVLNKMKGHSSITEERTSLVAQWLRIRLPRQGTWVRALGREDPTCGVATKPMRHSYWAHKPQLLKPVCLGPVLHNKRSHRNEKPGQRNEDPKQPKINK